MSQPDGNIEDLPLFHDLWSQHAMLGRMTLLTNPGDDMDVHTMHNRRATALVSLQQALFGSLKAVMGCYAWLEVRTVVQDSTTFAHGTYYLCGELKGPRACEATVLVLCSKRRYSCR